MSNRVPSADELAPLVVAMLAGGYKLPDIARDIAEITKGAAAACAACYEGRHAEHPSQHARSRFEIMSAAVTLLRLGPRTQVPVPGADDEWWVDYAGDIMQVAWRRRDFKAARGALHALIYNTYGEGPEFLAPEQRAMLVEISLRLLHPFLIDE